MEPSCCTAPLQWDQLLHSVDAVATTGSTPTNICSATQGVQHVRQHPPLGDQMPASSHE